VVWARATVRIRPKAPRERGAAGGARRCQRRGRGFEPRRSLHALLGQWQSQRVQTAWVRVRIPGRVRKEHWLSGYSSALLRRTPGDRCGGSSPPCSATRVDGRQLSLVRVLRHPPWKGKPSVGRRQRSRKPPRRKPLGVRASLSPLEDAQADWRRHRLETRRALTRLAGSTPAASAGHYPTGEGACLISR
jgi:hypothetical protein